MTELTNTQLAAMLRQEATAPGFMSAENLERAAQRLQAKEISEETVEQAAEAACATYAGSSRRLFPISETWRDVARAVLKAAGIEIQKVIGI
jgi:hypothetical protein